MYLGVDEAGKGPVLGPMVAAAVLADPSVLPADVDDSKRLAPARRESIDEAIRATDRVAVGVAFVEPAEIDRPDTDMNTLTVRGQARAARAALGGAVAADLDEPVRVVADAGDTSESRFARRLGEFVAGTGSATTDTDLPAVDVSAAHGADEDDPVVGAASVVAKVARDERMAAVDAEYAAYDGVGSGYPSDPTTRSFLRAHVDDHGEVPDCARRSWATCDDVLAAAEQSGLDEF
ncbi:ribonuclease HII [Halorubrum lipolyticum]|uniref:Ribonuclease HII n=1 Tax=Halorubrum lipolyticum DSM 21995 TaxID=1227482 RepID=M0NMY7_9EURY|nr:ribonuclease HII [Halorubrum lipolyticum]EMA59171.1 ribonuclease HII [Halorubrum lipolyticum DSM 21995]